MRTEKLTATYPFAVNNSIVLSGDITLAFLSFLATLIYMSDNHKEGHGWSRSDVTKRDEQPAPPRPVMADEDVENTSGEPWPFVLGRGEAVRSTAPRHEQEGASVANTPLVEPDEQPRPDMVKSVAEHGQAVYFDVAGQNRAGEVERLDAPLVVDEPTWPVAVEEEKVESEPVEVVEEQAEIPAVQAPPESADLVTVEEAVEIFRQRGLPRHMRTIQKYCSRKTGRVLESYQVPTENGIRYMIERSSIDRFIGDAAMQAPTGKLENETIAEPASREQLSAPTVDQLDIFEHPLVKRLEGQVERLENRNESLQANIQNVLEQANERLVELQKAAAVAQSESLGKFLLESERIRGGQEKKPPLTVNRGDDQFADFSV